MSFVRSAPALRLFGPWALIAAAAAPALAQQPPPSVELALGNWDSGRVENHGKRSEVVISRTVHVEGEAVRSCLLPIGALKGRRVITIEALGSAEVPHPLQRAWVAHQVPQCGYCQSGILMAAAALLAKNRKPSDAEIDAAIANVCRCGTYPRLRAAIRAAAADMA